MTPEEIQALADAQSLDELYELLESYLATGKISLDEAEAYLEQYGLPLEDAGDVLTGAPLPVAPGAPNNPPGTTEAPPYQPTSPWNLAEIFGKGYAAYLSPVDRAIYNWLHRNDTPQMGAGINLQGGVGTVPYGPAKAPDPVDQYLNDPEIKASLGAYTSGQDLANRIANLLAQGLIPDELTAGAIYNRFLGLTADRSKLDTAESNLATADLEDYPAFQAALATARKNYQAAQAILDQQAGMYIRAGAARGVTAAGNIMLQKQKLALNDLITRRKWEQEYAAEEAQDRAIDANLDTIKYFNGLKIVLDAQVRAGNMTQAQADQVYFWERNQLYQGANFSDLSYYDVVLAQLSGEEKAPRIRAMAAAEEATAKQWEAAAKLREKQRVQDYGKTYLPRLKAYLDRAVGQGSMTGEQAQIAYTGEQALIQQGIAPNSVYWNMLTPEQEQENLRITTMGKAEELQAKAREEEISGVGWKRTRAEELRLQGLPWLSDFMPRETALPAQPTYESIYEPFLAGIGAPNFRRFVESRLGRVAQETEAARSDWWRRMNAPQEPRPFGAVEGESYADVVTRLQGESGRLGELLKGAGIAPTMGGAPTATGPAWAWQQGQNVINAQLAELYGTPSAPSGAPTGQETFEKLMGGYWGAPARKEEDPFKAALGAYPFLSEFLSLGPTERGYQKSRFAPRVQYRF